jgi:hypothetical protein
MSPQVEAALIAAGVGVLTVITTAFTQYLGRRATSKQLDTTLAEQRLRTLNERFATWGAAKVSPEPAMGLGWGLIPVGQGRSAGTGVGLQTVTNRCSRRARDPPD